MRVTHVTRNGEPGAGCVARLSEFASRVSYSSSLFPSRLCARYSSWSESPFRPYSKCAVMPRDRERERETSARRQPRGSNSSRTISNAKRTAGQGRLLRITSRLRVKDTLRGNGCAARMRCRREKLDRGWWWLPPGERMRSCGMRKEKLYALSWDIS